jgi:hypothetical protein
MKVSRWFLLLLAVSSCFAQPTPRVFEVACPSGALDLFAPTFNPVTKKYRSWVCSDARGVVTLPGIDLAGTLAAAKLYTDAETTARVLAVNAEATARAAGDAATLAAAEAYTDAHSGGSQATLPAISDPQTATLSSPVSLTANSFTTVLSKSVTFPAGGTFRALVSYGSWVTAGANACAAEVVDTTNGVAFALSAQNANGTGYMALAASELSTAIYAAESSATFTLKVICNSAQTVTVNSGLFSLSPARPTYLSVTPVLNAVSSYAQLQADWTAGSGVQQILHKPTLAAVATSGAYGDLTGVPGASAAEPSMPTYPSYYAHAGDGQNTLMPGGLSTSLGNIGQGGTSGASTAAVAASGSNVMAVQYVTSAGARASSGPADPTIRWVTLQSFAWFTIRLRLVQTADTRLWFGVTVPNGSYTQVQASDFQTDAPAVPVVGFRYSTAAGDTKYQCVTSTGSAQTVTPESTASHVDATTQHAFGIYFDLTTVHFFIDGSEVCTQNTNLPTPSSSLLAWFALVDNLNVAVSDKFDVANLMLTARY